MIKYEVRDNLSLAVNHAFYRYRYITQFKGGELMSNSILFALVCGVAGVIYGIMTAIWVSKQDAGNQKMIDISNAVKEGANAFLAREYKTVAIVAVVLLAILFFVPALGKWAAAGFV